MNGVLEAPPTCTYTHAQMYTFAYTALTLYTLFSVIYSDTEHAVIPKLSHSHTPGHTHFVQHPGRWTESWGHCHT